MVSVISDASPDLVIIGPEQPLVLGIADQLRNLGIAVVGPGKKGAQLEGSKAFSKNLMAQAGIATARSETVDNIDQAMEAISSFEEPPVIKADGLAAGKGVVVAESFEAARAAVQDMMLERRFGEAGVRLVIEERLLGVEASYIVLTDGERFVPLTSSQDHKRLLDGDCGPNTGGMGAFAPTPMVGPEIERQIHSDVIEPVLATLRAQDIQYRGFLYAGLMLTDTGPKVLEFNVRAGDPETQAIVYGLESDLVPILNEVAHGQLSMGIQLSHRPTATIVMAAEGYPTDPLRGIPIHGLDEVAKMENVKVFHAGTQMNEGALCSHGGRVLAITARGGNLDDAIRLGYEAIKRIDFRGSQYRNDIGRTVLLK
jgi:phosphoribosylamine--glycine ligase